MSLSGIVINCYNMSSSISVNLLHGDVYVFINVHSDKNFKPKKKGFNWGYIEIKPIHTDVEQMECFWDNIEFFSESTLREIKEECEDELKEKGLFEKGLLKLIHKEVKRIKKLGFIRDAD